MQAATSIRSTSGQFRLPQPKTGVTWRESSSLHDEAWDAFLESVPEGQLQQSSRWAEAKAIEGWEPIRRLLVADGVLVGGFQILARQTRFGRIGYVSKGPVAAPQAAPVAECILPMLQTVARQHRLRALVVQAPDQTTFAPSFFAQCGFVQNHLVNVASATLLIDTDCPFDQVLARLRRTTRLEIKRGQKRGIKVRQATEADLGTFFDLMLESCRRQGSSPSPSSVDGLRRIWAAFQQGNRIRLTLAEFDGTPIAGGLFLCFGDRVTFWKKGWSGAMRDCHPNQQIMFEGIQWTHANGYRFFDLAAMNRSTAAALLADKELSTEQKSSRDFFLLGYGGRPVLLPESWAYFPNPILNRAYVLLFPRITAHARRLARMLLPLLGARARANSRRDCV